MPQNPSPNRPPVRRRRVSAAEAAGLGAVDGLTFGFSDELLGLVAPSMAEAMRAAQTRAQEEQGLAYGAGAVAGGALLPLGALGQAGRVARMARRVGVRPGPVTWRGDMAEVPLERFGRRIGAVRAKATREGADTRIQHTLGATKGAEGLGGGRALYKALADDAGARGGSLYSDSTVSPEAQRVYRSLARRGGYRVERADSAKATGVQAFDPRAYGGLGERWREARTVSTTRKGPDGRLPSVFRVTATPRPTAAQVMRHAFQNPRHGLGAMVQPAPRRSAGEALELVGGLAAIGGVGGAAIPATIDAMDLWTDWFALNSRQQHWMDQAQERQDALASDVERIRDDNGWRR